ncbi:MAG: SusC/RagA family TonB-linked outer membrane protein [Bacteroidota bacterium]
MRNLYQPRRKPWACSPFVWAALMLVVMLSGSRAAVAHDSEMSQHTTPIELDLKDATIKEALREIERQTKFNFVINDSRLRFVEKHITLSIRESDIHIILNQILEGTGISYKIKKNHITLIPPPDRRPMTPVADSGGRYFEINPDDNPMFENYIAAADINVSGNVKDESGLALPGVNVLVKGTTIGTVTDANGSFALAVPSNESILVFSFIGYLTKEVAVNGQTVIDVQLSADVKTLSEVVVIGYGTQKKSDLTGAVSSVKAEEIMERPAASLNQSLAGRITGVWINTNSGRPGGQTNVRIRGFSSINTSNNPLYVVDGVILPVGTQTQNSNSIDFINPSDIASVEVLKDASATAIYGARGANGVILITTKRGSSTGGRITYDLQVSVPTIGPKRVEMLNAQEFIQVEDLAYKNAQFYDPAGWAAGTYVDPKLKRTDPRLFDASGNPIYNTDWFKESTQNKPTQNHQLSITGGNKDHTYGVFVGYRDENGLLLNSYLKRYSARFSFDSQINSWIKMGGSLSYNNQDENLVDIGTGGLNSVRMITEAIPILPIKFPDGTWAGNADYPGMEGGENPVNILTNRIYQLLTQTTLGNVYANINLAQGLEFRSILGTSIVTRERGEYNGKNLRGISSPLGSSVLNSNRESYYSFENYLTYNKRLAEIHAFTGLLGISFQETNIFGFTTSVRGMLDDYLSFNNFGSAATFNPSGSGRARFAFNSYFGRVNYSLKDKYLFTITGRADGASKFGESRKFSFFPSAALAWKVSEEPFMRGISAISNLKLRTSYGVTGNSEIPTYSALERLGAGYSAIFNNQRVTGVGINSLSNPNLRWEKTAQSDIGLEIGLFNNKISIETDVYYRKTTDMLLSAPLPTSSGFGSIVKNVGSMENKGFEFAITSENIQKGDFTWTTSFNISMNRNKVLSLATPAPIFGLGNPNFTNPTGIIQEGASVGSFWGLVRLGTWSTADAAEAAKYSSYRGGKQILPGDIRYADLNGDYFINDADRIIIGNGNPDAFGSFINSVRFKNFDFTLELQYSYGNDVLNQTLHSAEDRQAIANSYSSVLNAWTPEHQNTPIAAIRDTRAGYVTNVDTHWVEDGSFLRGKNLLIGYSLPASLTDRLHVERFRVYGSVQNFFLATKFTGNDPEVTTYGNPFAQGQTFFDYPKPTVYMLGLSVGL